MFKITKEFTFEAAHKLPHHDGKCARLHGHSWKLRVELNGEVLFKEGAKSGMLRDFSDVKKVAAPLVEAYLDHHYLNETTGLENPTSENLAHWIFNRLAPQIPELAAVEIDETCTCSCRFEPTDYERK